MKWSEIKVDKDYYSLEFYNENEKITKGFLLHCLGIDLEDIPEILLEHFQNMNINFGLLNSHKNYFTEEKIYVKNVIGTAHSSYSNVSFIEAYIRLVRACNYIKNGDVTRKKYKKLLQKRVSEQLCPSTPISFIKKNEKYYIYGNGNHRVITYKLMYLVDKYLRRIKSDMPNPDRVYYLYVKVLDLEKL